MTLAPHRPLLSTSASVLDITIRSQHHGLLRPAVILKPFRVAGTRHLLPQIKIGLEVKSICQVCLEVLRPLWVSVQFSSVTQSLRSCGLQHVRLPCPSPISRACSNSCPLSQWCQITISSSAFNLSQHQGLFQWVSSLHQVAQVLEFQLQHQPFQ